MTDWKELGEEALEDLKTTSANFWTQIKDDQRPIVVAAVKDLAQLSVQYLREPQNREQLAREIEHVKGTLESHAALVALRARRKAVEAVMRTLTRIAQVGLGLLSA